jgi:hypothetical protein
MKLTPDQLIALTKAESVGGEYIAFWKRKHVCVARIIDGHPFLTPEGEKIILEETVEDAEIVPTGSMVLSPDDGQPTSVQALRRRQRTQ